jgi:protein gp37
MSIKTTIAWTDMSWNPVRGCSLVSAGCANCYAMKTAHRFNKPGMAYEGLTELGPQGPRWNGKIQLVREALDEPLHWNKPRRVFVNSMSDLFHEDVPFEFIDQVFAVMLCSPRHTFQILTKRPARMLEYVNTDAGFRRSGYIWNAAYKVKGIKVPKRKMPPPFPYPHIWLGVSIEDQATADERIPILVQTPAAVRWISAEPLLGDLYISHSTLLFNLDWVVVGGESGSQARPCNIAWIRSIRDQCRAAYVPYFIKQLGARPFEDGCEPGHVWRGTNPASLHRLTDRKGGDPQEWPEDLRIREWP